MFLIYRWRSYLYILLSILGKIYNGIKHRSWYWKPIFPFFVLKKVIQVSHRALTKKHPADIILICVWQILIVKSSFSAVNIFILPKPFKQILLIIFYVTCILQNFENIDSHFTFVFLRNASSLYLNCLFQIV